MNISGSVSSMIEKASNSKKNKCEFQVGFEPTTPRDALTTGLLGPCSETVGEMWAFDWSHFARSRSQIDDWHM